MERQESVDVPDTRNLFSHALPDVPDGYYLQQWRSFTQDALRVSGASSFYSGLCGDMPRNFEAELVYKHLALVAKEATAAWLGQPPASAEPSSASALLATAASAFVSQGQTAPEAAQQLPFYQLHHRLVQLAHLPCQAYLEAATWTLRQTTMREFLTANRMKAGVRILDAIRRRDPGPVDGFHPLTEDARSYLHPSDGLFVHVWRHPGEGRRFVSCAQKLWQTIFEHRIRGVVSPISAAMHAKGTCITFTLLAPIGDGPMLDQAPAPNAARDLASLLALLVGTTFEAGSGRRNSIGQLTQGHVCGGIDGRCYLTLPTLFGTCPEDISSPTELRRTPIRLERYYELFPKGAASPTTPLLSRIRATCIAKVVEVLLTVPNTKAVEVLQQGIIPNAMKANGLNTRFMFLLHLELGRAAQRTPSHVAVCTALEIEMLFRGIKCIVQSELASAFHSDDATYVARVNRLMKTIVGGNASVWQQLLALVQEKFGVNNAVTFAYHPRLVKVFTWYIGTKLGVNFNGSTGAFDSLVMGGIPNSSYYLVPDSVRFSLAQRRTEALDLLGASKANLLTIPTGGSNVGERECRRLRLVFLELMLAVEGLGPTVHDISTVLFEQRQRIDPVHLIVCTSFTVELLAAVAPSQVLQSTALQLARQTLEASFFPLGLLRAPVAADDGAAPPAVQRQNRRTVADYLLCWRRVVQRAGGDAQPLLVCAASCLLAGNAERLASDSAAVQSIPASALLDGSARARAIAVTPECFDFAVDMTAGNDLAAVCLAPPQLHPGLATVVVHSLFARRDAATPSDLLRRRRRATALLSDQCLSKPQPEDAAKLLVLCEATAPFFLTAAPAGGASAEEEGRGGGPSPKAADPEHAMAVLRLAISALRCTPGAAPDVLSATVEVFRELNAHYPAQPLPQPSGCSVCFFSATSPETEYAMHLLQSTPFSRVLGRLVAELLAQKEYRKAVLVESVYRLYGVPATPQLQEASVVFDRHVAGSSTIKQWWKRVTTGQGALLAASSPAVATAQRRTHVRAALAYAAGLAIAFAESWRKLQRLQRRSAEEVARLCVSASEQTAFDALLAEHGAIVQGSAVDAAMAAESAGRQAIYSEEAVAAMGSLLHPLLLGVAGLLLDAVQQQGQAMGNLLAAEAAARQAEARGELVARSEAVLTLEATLAAAWGQEAHSCFASAFALSHCVGREANARGAIDDACFAIALPALVLDRHSGMADSACLDHIRVLLTSVEALAGATMAACAVSADAERTVLVGDFGHGLLDLRQAGATGAEAVGRRAVLAAFAASLLSLFEDYYVAVRLAALRSAEQTRRLALMADMRSAGVAAPEAAGRVGGQGDEFAARCHIFMGHVAGQKAVFMGDMLRLRLEPLMRTALTHRAAVGRMEVLPAMALSRRRAAEAGEAAVRRAVAVASAVGALTTAVGGWECRERLHLVAAMAVAQLAAVGREEAAGRQALTALSQQSVGSVALQSCVAAEATARAGLRAKGSSRLAELLASGHTSFGKALFAAHASGMVARADAQEAAQRAIHCWHSRDWAPGLVAKEETLCRTLLEARQLLMLAASRRLAKLAATEEMQRLRLAAEEAKMYSGVQQLYILMLKVCGQRFHRPEVLMPSAVHLKQLQRAVGASSPSKGGASPTRTAAGSPTKAHTAERHTSKPVLHPKAAGAPPPKSKPQPGDELPTAKHLKRLHQVLGQPQKAPANKKGGGGCAHPTASNSADASQQGSSTVRALFKPLVPPLASLAHGPLPAGGCDADCLGASALSVSFPNADPTIAGDGDGDDQSHTLDTSQSFGVFSDETTAAFERRLVTFLERRPTFVAKVRDEKLQQFEAHEQTLRHQLEEQYVDEWLCLVRDGDAAPDEATKAGVVQAVESVLDEPDVSPQRGFDEVLQQEAETDIPSPTAMASHVINWPQIKRLRKSLQVREHLTRENIASHHHAWLHGVTVEWHDFRKLHLDTVNHSVRAFVVLLPALSALCLPPPSNVTDAKTAALCDTLRRIHGEQRRLVQMCEERFKSLRTKEDVAHSKLRAKFKSRLVMLAVQEAEAAKESSPSPSPARGFSKYMRLVPQPQNEVEPTAAAAAAGAASPQAARRSSFRWATGDSPRLRAHSVLCLVPSEADVELSELMQGIVRVLGIVRTKDEVPLVERKLRLRFIEAEFRCRARLIELLTTQQEMPARRNSSMAHGMLQGGSSSPLPPLGSPMSLSPGRALDALTVSSRDGVAPPPLLASAPPAPLGGGGGLAPMQGVPKYRPGPVLSLAGNIPSYCDRRTAQMQVLRLMQDHARFCAAHGIKPAPMRAKAMSAAGGKASPLGLSPLPAIGQSSSPALAK